MKFRYAILYVDNVEETLTFYQTAFGFERLFLHESGQYGELKTGDTKLAFSAKELMAQLGKTPGLANPAAPLFELAFETDDVAGAMQRAIAAGATEKQAPRDEPWGQTTAYVIDPNGFLVELCTPMGD